MNFLTSGWANRYATGWHGRLDGVDFDLLSPADLNRRKMLGPDQYGGDVLTRAPASRSGQKKTGEPLRARRFVFVSSGGDGQRLTPQTSCE